MGNTVQIQMPLHGEGVEVWRPVFALPLGGELFVVDAQQIPETEDWAFGAGSVVRCLDRRFADGSVYLTAEALVPQEPTTVRQWLEFHDSVLERAVETLDSIELSFLGYVHHWETRAGIRFGLGMMQPILFRIGRSGPPAVVGSAIGISFGSLLADGMTYSNLVPLPLRALGSTRLTLEFSDGRIVEVSGTDCAVAANGAARFVEIIPADLYPGGPA